MIKGDEYESLGNRLEEQQAKCLPTNKSDRARWPMVNGLCSLCHVNFAMSFHHLIPKAVAKRHTIQMVVIRQDTDKHALIPICRPCHIFIHKAFTHKQLALNYNTHNKLKEHPLVNQFTEFIQKRAVGKRIKGKRIIIEGEMVSIKGCLPVDSFKPPIKQHEALEIVDKFFRRRNWQRQWSVV